MDNFSKLKGRFHDEYFLVSLLKNLLRLRPLVLETILWSQSSRIDLLF